MAQPPNDLSYLIEFLDRMVVPLTMAWLVFCWFWMLDDPEKEREGDKAQPDETEDLRNKRVEKAKKAKRRTCRASAKGLGAGMVLAILLLFYLYSFALKGEPVPPKNVLQIAPLAAWVSVLVGGLIGILMRVLQASKVKEFIAIRPFGWGCIVTTGTALGLTSLVIYYAGPSPNCPHAWLVWGYVSLLFSYRVAFLVGD
jgi:hypothetical protein